MRCFALPLWLAAFWLVGCAAPHTAAPIKTLPQPPTQRLLHHWVDAGETLYSIAWRYDLDYRDLARVNGLREPYRLQRNQRLTLDMSSPPATRSDTSPSVVRRANKPARTPTAVASELFDNRWQWPASGSVERGFAPAAHHHGLSLAGSGGRPVKSAAAGLVVYAGEGLRGFGKLVIVKHSDLLLSAYGHNSVLKVKEGDAVKVDTELANAAENGRVYFEIRRDGKPVNPINFLPVR